MCAPYQHYAVHEHELCMTRYYTLLRIMFWVFAFFGKTMIMCNTLTMISVQVYSYLQEDLLCFVEPGRQHSKTLIQITERD